MSEELNEEMPTQVAIHYFAIDGNYGNADGIVLCQTQDWTEEDWTEIENATDSERANVAVEISRQYGNLLLDTPSPDTI
jgi:hypothetical protein